MPHICFDVGHLFKKNWCQRWPRFSIKLQSWKILHVLILMSSSTISFNIKIKNIFNLPASHCYLLKRCKLWNLHTNKLQLYERFELNVNQLNLLCGKNEHFLNISTYNTKWTMLWIIEGCYSFLHELNSYNLKMRIKSIDWFAIWMQPFFKCLILHTSTHTKFRLIRFLTHFPTTLLSSLTAHNLFIQFCIHCYDSLTISVI